MAAALVRDAERPRTEAAPLYRRPDARPARERRVAWRAVIAYHPLLATTSRRRRPAPTSPMHTVRTILSTFALVAALGACSSTASLDPRTWFRSSGEPPAPKAREQPGVDARLRGVGAPVTGTVRMRESGDLLVIFVDIAAGAPGPYRVVLHETGNCSSPNGFSAGAPWSPPGWRESALRLVPEVYANINGQAQLTARVRGVRLGDAVKRSVLVYQGTTPEVPRPDVRNNVVACGVFEQATTLF